MRILFVFVIGMMVGGIAALLIAPERGDDLRMQLQERAGQDFTRMQNLWKEDIVRMSEQMASLQSQFTAMQTIADEQTENSSEESAE